MAPKNAKNTEAAVDGSQLVDANATQSGDASGVAGDGGNGDPAAATAAEASAATGAAENVTPTGGSQDGGSSLPSPDALATESGIGTGAASAMPAAVEPAATTTTEVFPAVVAQRLPPPFLDKSGNPREFASDVKLDEVVMLRNVKIDGVFLEAGGTYSVPFDIWSALDDLDAVED